MGGQGLCVECVCRKCVKAQGRPSWALQPNDRQEDLEWEGVDGEMG